MNDFRSKPWSFRFCVVLLAATSVGCNSKSDSQNAAGATASKSNRVVAVSYALQYLTQRIAGDVVEVEFPVPKTTDPKSWKPSVAEIQSLQSADLVVINGDRAAYAKWRERVALVNSKLSVSTRDFSDDDLFRISDHKVVHAHGPGGEDSHAFSVPYCWLDPKLAKKQAAEIHRSLAACYPEHAEAFATNLSQLNADLDELVGEFAKVRIPAPKELVGEIPATRHPFDSLFSANPLTGCFTRAIGATDYYLFLFDAKSREDLLKSNEKLTALTGPDGPSGPENKSRYMLVNPDFESEFAEFLNTLPDGMETISIDLLDHAPETGDYLSVMRANLNAVKNLAN